MTQAAVHSPSRPCNPWLFLALPLGLAALLLAFEPVTLALALPRPHTLAKVLQQGTAMGKSGTVSEPTVKKDTRDGGKTPFSQNSPLGRRRSRPHTLPEISPKTSKSFSTEH